jgi:ABC-type Zn uptake system ZnuABC Zn-binding protein ZnuA
VIRRLAALLLLLPVWAGCGGGADHEVVATTTQAADLARAVAGDRLRVTGLLPANADPHEHELRPQDVKALIGARLVVRSGGDVDAWLDEAIDAAGTAAPVVTLGDAAPRLGDDPHWWQDPRAAIAAVSALRAALARVDPGGADGYARRAAAYTRRLRALDRAVARCIARVPPAERTIVTTHDSLGYYARRYGLRVVGAVIPARTTVAQPSAGEVTELIATIRREHVRAVFAERAVNAKVEAAIARAAGARVGRPLWADTLGPEGSGAATYVDAIAANTDALVDGMTGGAVRCRLEPKLAERTAAARPPGRAVRGL